jgi:hypothetical protein
LSLVVGLILTDTDRVSHYAIENRNAKALWGGAGERVAFYVLRVVSGGGVPGSADDFEFEITDFRGGHADTGLAEASGFVGSGDVGFEILDSKNGAAGTGAGGGAGVVVGEGLLSLALSPCEGEREEAGAGGGRRDERCILVDIFRARVINLSHQMNSSIAMKVHRLVVNPNTPQAWEILLKPGENSLGRGDANDFKLNDPSVSGSHCRITVGEGSVVIRDQGSTNGTFVNRAPVREAALASGQTLRLGGLEMLYLADGEPAAAAQALPPPRPAAVRVSVVPAPAAVTVTESPPPVAPPVAHAIQSGPRFCKFHPKSRARYQCHKCNRSFCDLCVNTRDAHGQAVKTCRSCGVELVPLHVEASAPAARAGFFAQLPGAVIYPLKGSGLLVLIVATILFAALSRVGWFAILLKAAGLGYIFAYMQNIIYATAAEEKQVPELPAMDGLFGSCLSLVGTVLMSFGLAIALAVARFMFELEAIPMAAIMAATVFGCLYFPMAFLATAMKDTALAANPLVVVPAILKVPLEYIVAVVVMGSIFGVQQLGDLVAGGAGSLVFTTRSMSTMFMALGFQAVWSFLSVYLLTVNTRILGLLYVAKKDQLNWF